VRAIATAVIRRDIGKPERFELSSNRPADELVELGKQWARWQYDATPTRASVLGQFRAATRFKLPTNITTPLLVLTAAKDRLVSHRCSDEIAAKLRAPIRTHPTAGHDLPNDDPTWIVDQVRDWTP
jgi:pimeloyl-ACP methyl ester carboxylesterase